MSSTKKIEITIRGGSGEDRVIAATSILLEMTDTQLRDVARNLFDQNKQKFRTVSSAMHGIMYKELNLNRVSS